MKRIPLTISIILLLCSHASAQSEVDRGVVHDGMYTNHGFGFTYRYPKDWVVHGAATNERIRDRGKKKVAESGASKATVDVPLKTLTELLTVRRYPAGTPGIDFNPAINVIAVKVAHAPEITSGKDYLLNVRALMIKAGSHQVLLKEPMEYRVAGSQFFRDSYAVEFNGVQRAEASFAKVTKGYALVFIFLGKDQKSLDEMTKSMETFVDTGVGIGPALGTGVGIGSGVHLELDKIYTGREVDTKARLVSKPEPNYTAKARMYEVTGTVVLKVVFSAQGTVTNIRTIAGLPYGLTERAIEAARKIKFIPATKDGKYVSMWMQLEYNFSLD